MASGAGGKRLQGGPKVYLSKCFIALTKLRRALDLIHPICYKSETEENNEEFVIQNKFIIGSLLVVLLLSGCSQEIDKKKFENVDHAARSVKRSLAAGAIYGRFGDLLQELSTEITALNGKVKRGKEQQLLKEYSELLTIYRDGLILWKYRIEATRYDFIPRGLIYVGQDVEPIVEKYRIPTESHTYGPTHQSWKSIPGDSLQTIWMNANSELEKIEGLLKD